MLAGEYATLQPGGVAVALAVAQYLEVKVQPATALEICSPFLGPTAVRPPTGDPFLDAALNLSPALPLRLTLSADLNLPGRAKGGLGSSAAAVLGVMAALDCPDPIPALLAHLRAQSHQGSGYDVLTCALGGVVALPTPQQPLLELDQMETSLALARLRAQLKPQRLSWPQGLKLGRVATGEGANTRHLIQRARGHDPAPLAVAAWRVIRALKLGEVGELLDALNRAQRAFEAWDAAGSLGLMTTSLWRLAEEARSQGLIPRVSGAGGGDSLLILGGDRLEPQLQCWRRQGWRAEMIEIDTGGVQRD